MKNLKGKKVLVTGGAQGIGFAAAQCFAEEGADVFIADIKLEDAETAAERLQKEYGITSRAYMLDVGDRDSISSCFRTYKNEQQTLDVLVNNAGITRDNLLMKRSGTCLWIST